MFDRNLLFGLGAFAAIGFVTAPVDPASALSVRTVYNGTSVTVADNGVGDTDPTVDRVSYDGTGNAAFNDFSTLNVLGFICTGCVNRLGFNPAVQSAGVVDDLVLLVSDTGFSTGNDNPLLFESDFAGIKGNVDVTYETFWDGSDSLFAETNLVAQSTLSGNAGADFDTITGGNGGNPFSMTIKLTFGQTGWGNIGQPTVEPDAQLRASAVPVPAALPLMAGALGVFGLVRARRRAA